MNSQLLKFPFQYVMNVPVSNQLLVRFQQVPTFVGILSTFVLRSLRQTRTADLYIISVAL